MSQAHPPALPHSRILALGTGMHWVQGSIKMGPGISVSRNMTIIEHDGAVTVVNAVRLDEAGEAELAALGKVEHVVKLGFFHGRDDAYYRDHFGAKYWALPSGTRDVDPEADETLTTDHLPVPDSSLIVFEDAKKPEAALLVNRDGGVMITCDSVQNWPDTRGCSVPAKVVTRIMGFTKRPAQIGGPWRKFMTPKDGTLRDDFTRLAACEFDKLIAAHGAPLTSGAAAALRATVAATFP